MSDFVLHIPDESNRILLYQCGLEAGQTVTLRKDLVVTEYGGRPTGKVHPEGERWRVLPGITSDPVLWFLRPDGDRCPWDDDSQSADEWFIRGDPA